MSLGKNVVFDHAHEKFLDSLPDKERARFAPCSSSNELFATLLELKTLSSQRQKRTLNRCLNVLKKLDDRLRPYFDALNVIAGTHSTLALTYGAFRLVLQLASGFPAFFEKLIAVFDRLAGTFPQYNAIIDLFDGHPPARMRRHLEAVYLDLFQFIQMTAKVFTASSGKVKRPLGMIATVIWKPFDAQYSGLLNSIDDHRKFILDELTLHQAQEAKNSVRAAAIERERAERERLKADEDRREANDLAGQTRDMKKALDAEIRESSIQRILEWLAPPKFAERLENSLEQREDGTAEWIFETEVYKTWTLSKPGIEEGVKWDKMPPWALWVHGNPGCGKTILASSVIEEVFDQRRSDDQSDLTCYHFFKYDDVKSSTLDSAYRSALAQILHHRRDMDQILDSYLFARLSLSSTSGQLQATSKELYDLVRVCADKLGQLTFILDGIDEADEPELIGRKLHELVNTSPIKLLCFSRPNINCLHSLIPHNQRILVNREAMNSDIGIFLEHQLQELLEHRKLPANASIQHLVNKLVCGADGMFLWAKLMTNHLNSFALSPQSRLEVINAIHFPEGLNAMYDRIITLITTSDPSQVELAQRILMWANHVAEENFLSCEFLQTAIRENENDHESLDEFSSVVVSVCGGLIECNPQHLFQFTHLTVRDYINENPWSRINLATPLLLDKAMAAGKLMSRCLEYILSHGSSQRSTEDTSLSLPFEFNRSFEGYAIKYWALHLQDARSLQPSADGYTEKCIAILIEPISRFLDNPKAVAFWIEGLYRQSTSEKTSEWIESWVYYVLSQASSPFHQTAEHLRELSMEMKLLDEQWGTRLNQNPALIWDDVLVFSKTGLLSKIGASVGTRLATNLEPIPVKDANGDKIQCLCTISSSTYDGAIMATLSIYPSSSFKRFWKSINPITAYEEAEKFISGWTAGYEIWSTDFKTRKASISIPLPESEIRLLIRQSFHHDIYRSRDGKTQEDFHNYNNQDDRNFDTSFPIAIGHDLRTFSVLRTIYRISPENSSSTETLESCALPLDFLLHFDEKWGSQLQRFHPHAPNSLPDHHHVGWRDWYNYSISFGTASGHLAFADYQMPCLVNLAIFEIMQEPKFGCRLVRSTMIRSGPERAKGIVFHKELLLVAFLSGNRVWIWKVREDDSKPIPLPARPGGCERGLYKNDCVRHKRPFKECAFKSLDLSACGRYLLARNQTDVEVFNIPLEMLTSESSTHVSNTEIYQATSMSSLGTASTAISVLHDAGLAPGSIFTESHAMIRSENPNCSQSLLITTTNNELKLESVIQDSSKARDHLHILTMPQSFDTENTNISFRIPTSIKDSLRVIFNKRAAENYSLSEGRQVQPPSIIERDLTSVLQVTGTQPFSMLEHDEGHAMPKRRKILDGKIDETKEGDANAATALPKLKIWRGDEQVDRQLTGIRLQLDNYQSTR